MEMRIYQNTRTRYCQSVPNTSASGAKAKHVHSVERAGMYVAYVCSVLLCKEKDKAYNVPHKYIAAWREFSVKCVQTAYVA